MLNSLYKISNLEATGTSLSCNVSYNAQHPVFGGHFPGQPVVPGVCTMAMIKDLLTGQMGQSLVLTNAAQVKFLRLILPEVNPAVSIRWQEMEEGIQVNADLKEGDAFLFKMSAVFKSSGTGK